jgi:Mycothiol maleylpyruvate isomerase N-terminal domain
VTATTDSYLAAAAAATALLSEAAVAERWAAPSALPDMSVAALAGHLARQIFSVEALVAQDACDQRPISLLDHYARVTWIDAGLDDEPNVSVRRAGAAEAAEGPAALASRARGSTGRLRASLPGEPLDRVVVLPWGPWPLTLADLLTTRMLEIAVHGDDLAHSTGLPAPDLPADVTDTVVVLLARLAVRRHGPTAILRALSRAERAPAAFSAF